MKSRGSSPHGPVFASRGKGLTRHWPLLSTTQYPNLTGHWTPLSITQYPKLITLTPSVHYTIPKPDQNGAHALHGKWRLIWFKVWHYLSVSFAVALNSFESGKGIITTQCHIRQFTNESGKWIISTQRHLWQFTKESGKWMITTRRHLWQFTKESGKGIIATQLYRWQFTKESGKAIITT